MGEVKEVQLQITGEKDVPLTPRRGGTTTNQPPPPLSSLFKRWKWWLVVFINIVFILAGQTAGNLLGRFYFDQGGNSKWMATLVQSAGFPILLLPMFFLSSAKPAKPADNTTCKPSRLKVAAIYTGLGLMSGGDNLMYTYGIMFLPVSTYSLICASQLAFNAVFSYFINSQKFTHLILNSVILLTFSAALLGVRSDSTVVVHENHLLGFILTLCASATFSLILSLMQLTFEKVLRKNTYLVVLEMQFCVNIVAATVSLIGIFASGEWRKLDAEMQAYATGRVSYVMTLVWTTVSWQLAFVGTIGSVFVVSSLFSNVMSTMALPISPFLAVAFFHDKMDGVKVVSMLIAIWGFISYIYQHYLDDLNEKKGRRDDAKEISGSFGSS